MDRNVNNSDIPRIAKDSNSKKEYIKFEGIQLNTVRIIEYNANTLIKTLKKSLLVIIDSSFYMLLGYKAKYLL